MTDEHDDSTKTDPGELLLEADTQSERDEREEFNARQALTLAFEKFQRIKTPEAQDTALLIGELIRGYGDGKVSDEARRLRKSAAQKNVSLSVPSGIDAIRELIPQLATSMAELRGILWPPETTGRNRRVPDEADKDKALDRASWQVWTLLRSSSQLPFWNRGPVTAEFEAQKLDQIRSFLSGIEKKQTDLAGRLFVRLAIDCEYPRKKAHQDLDNALRVKVR